MIHYHWQQKVIEDDSVLSLSVTSDIYTWCMRFIPVYSAVALSAVSGQVLWKKVMSEAVMYIQCGLQYSTVPSPVCLLICKSYIMAVNGTTGRTQCCPSCAEVNKINQLQVFISKHSKIFPFPPQERSCGHHQLRALNLRQCYFQTSRATHTQICL